MAHKIVLVDGNNLMFRSYYATAYTGNLMKNSKGLVTNALYGFANMINKIIAEEKPEYMCVAFDVGASFRHREYKDYKAGRQKTPEELKIQMPIARELLNHMGIFNINVTDYEADDIIGTLSNWANKDPEWIATLITSDHDYLQLITDQVSVKLLQPKGFKMYTPKSFFEDYGIEPIKVRDLKGLMGDSSDNIPGVPGVGEKTALKLLIDYGTLEGVYENIDSIKGKLKEKLVENESLAIFSKKMATIVENVPMEYKFDDMKYNGPMSTLDDFYRDLEFYSLISEHKKESKPVILSEYELLEDLNVLNNSDVLSYYIECDSENYHTANILGMGLFDGKKAYYVSEDKIVSTLEYISSKTTYTFDLKKNMCLLKNTNLNTIYDLSIASYLLNESTKDDISILMNRDSISIDLYSDIIKRKDNIKEYVTMKAKYIYDTHDKYVMSLKSEEMDELFNNIEMPLVKVLAKMELNGIKCDANILKDMGDSIEVKIDELSKEIYKLCGVEFNISSPKQLGNVLFETLALPYKGKKKDSYSTSADVLEKLIGVHPVIELILEYRNITKLYSTYLSGLSKYILDDGKIHTIYKQTLTRTGRLSSVEPNLQNIPTRDELGRNVKKAFLPTNDLFLSADYSQIELRILAHISQSTDLIKAFVNGDDIHTFVASDLFNKSYDEVTKNERRIAKSVIFGIVYGISGFGLGENIGVSPKEAKKFIEKYYELYPGVKEYMDLIIKDAYNSGYVRTLFNRKRNIDELFNSNFMIRQGGERIALNTPIQGTSADIIKMAMIKIDELFTKNNIKSKMILQIHDELVFDVIESEKEKVVSIVKETMENIVKLSVPLKVSTDFGTDWYETK